MIKAPKKHFNKRGAFFISPAINISSRKIIPPAKNIL